MLVHICIFMYSRVLLCECVSIVHVCMCVSEFGVVICVSTVMKGNVLYDVP